MELPAALGLQRYLLTRKEAGTGRLPLDLDGSDLKLHVRHTVDVVDREGSLRCQTASYNYRLTRGDDTLIRWEYERSKPADDYPYPLAHVHVHGAFDGGGDATELHIPTMRMPIELILWHVICEERWGVKPRASNWEEILGESLDGFHERRSNRH